MLASLDHSRHVPLYVFLKIFKRRNDFRSPPQTAPSQQQRDCLYLIKKKYKASVPQIAKAYYTATQSVTSCPSLGYSCKFSKFTMISDGPGHSKSLPLNYISNKNRYFSRSRPLPDRPGHSKSLLFN